MPYGSGAMLQPITTHGEYADDVRGASIVGTYSQRTIVNQPHRPVMTREEGERWNTETATQARRERRNRWHRVNGPGPPLHPEGDGSLLHWSGVVKSYWIVVEVISSSNVNVGVLVGVITCVGV